MYMYPDPRCEDGETDNRIETSDHKLAPNFFFAIATRPRCKGV